MRRIVILANGEYLLRKLDDHHQRPVPMVALKSKQNTNHGPFFMKRQHSPNRHCIGYPDQTGGSILAVQARSLRMHTCQMHMSNWYRCRHFLLVDAK